MKLYADETRWRVRQIIGDVLLLAWIWLWVRVGQHLYRAIEQLRAVGEGMEGAGGTVARSMGDIADNIDDLPLVGGTLQSPFERAADAGRSLRAAGVQQSQDVHTLAWWAGVLIALLPIGWALARHLPGRIRWVREATAVQQLQIDGSDLELFALRAVATRPLHELRRACHDPAAALAARDFEPLARLEMAALGLRVRPPDQRLR